MKWAESYLNSVVQAAQEVDLGKVYEAVGRLKEAGQNGRTVFVIGNGGSAANASHLAQDLCKCALPNGFRAMSLTDNTAFITAVSNDIGYEEIFSFQLKQFARPKDVLVAISSSGQSPNVLKAVEYAKDNDLYVIGMTGFTGGELGAGSDLHLNVPIDDVCKAEAVHGMIMHMISELLKLKMSDGDAE